MSGASAGTPTGSAPTGDAATFAAGLKRERRLLGLDVGTKTIGVAVSDPLRSLASPVETVARTKLARDLERLAALVAKYEATGIVVGLPLNMDGTEGPRCQSVRQFVKDMAARIALPTLMQDERLSSAAVERTMIDSYDMSRRKRSERIDAGAAAWILQSALDRLAYLNRTAT